MYDAIEAVLVLLLVTNLLLLGSSLLSSCIRIVALQGIALALLPLLLHTDGHVTRTAALALGMAGLKGFLFPYLLSRALREVNARREVEPYVSHTASILIGVAIFVFSLWVSGRLNLNGAVASSLMAPAGLATLLVGLFVTISRRKAISQTLGYIVMENGIYLFGAALVGQIPALLELGVLMDAFVAVFIMSIASYHISREFDHINVDQLDSLKG